MKKKVIEIFMLNKELNNQPSQECCNPGCCSGYERSLTIDELVDKFSEKYESIGEFKLYTLTEVNKEEFISRMNQVFLNSNEKLKVSESNLDFVLSKVNPLIAVEGKLISVNNYPDENQLYNAITTGKKIKMKPRCC